MTASFVEEVVAAAPDDPRFSALQHGGGLRWVSEPVDHLRRVFEFQAIKGATYSARWGWSVDFVPVLKGATLSWKRTAAKADFDLCINPIDISGDVPSWCSFTTSASRAIRSSRCGRFLIDAAFKDWPLVHSRRNLVELFQSSDPEWNFGDLALDNYVQTHLAWGLVLLSLGDGVEGERHIAEFCERFESRSQRHNHQEG